MTLPFKSPFSLFSSTEKPMDFTASARNSTRAPSSLVQLIKEDLDAFLAYDPSTRSKLETVLFSAGFRAVMGHRIEHALWKSGHAFLACMLAKRTRRVTGIEIHPAAQFGRRTIIDHGMGIVIGSTVIIGNDVLIYQGVTLGASNPQQAGRRHPKLGNGVLVGANAVVLGGITVGDNAKIGAGAVVVKDVPASLTVVGVPAHTWFT